MAKDKILLIGGGGHCKSVIDVIEATNRYDIVGIIDVKEKVGGHLLGYPIIGTDQEIGSLQIDIDAYHISLGMIGTSDKRSKIYHELKERGFNFPTIISPYAYVSKHAQIGEGTIIMHHAVVNAGSSIGENCIINTKSLIEHDAIIKDHTHIATGAIINGNVTVGEGSFIGSGSVSKQGCTISANSFVKANSIIK